MKVFVPQILTSLLVCMAAIHAVQAQDTTGATNSPNGLGESASTLSEPVPYPPFISDAPGQAAVGNYFGSAQVTRPFEPLIRFDARTSRLYGYNDGYTRISAFLPKFVDDDTLFFLDLGGFASYNPSGGTNLGAGWRGYFEDFDRLLGLSAWYDYDGANQRSYHQFGLSFESLGRYFDWRANGYIPVGTTSNVVQNTVSGPAYLASNNILFHRLILRESIYTGFDTEIGGPAPILGRYGLSSYVGFYYFTSANVGGFTGISGRIQAQLNDSWTMGAQVTHDHVFDTNAQLQVTFTIPDGKPSRWLRQLSVHDRMTQPVFRNYRTVVHEDFIDKAEQAINPNTNQPFFVVYVDPNKTAGTGDGTLENPYSQLSQFDNLAAADKSSVNIIYVKPNDNGTSTQLDTGVTLLSNQYLWGSSVDHQITATQGTFDMLATTSGIAPVLENSTGGNVVTFTTGANNVEVSGFTINGSATGDGIYGLNNSAVSINQNTIHGAKQGVELENLTGTMAASTDARIDSNFFVDNIFNGFFINNTAAGPLEISLTNNTATGNGGNGFSMAANSGSSIGGIITGNSTGTPGTDASNGMHGLSLVANDGTINFFDDTQGWAIGGADTLSNSFSNNTLMGVNVSSINNSTVSLKLLNNDFTENSVNGFALSADGGTSTVQFGSSTAEDGNRFTTNGEDGIYFGLTGTAAGSFIALNNTMVGNGGGSSGGSGGGTTSNFNIGVAFASGLTASQEAIFTTAATKWQSIIIGDIPDVGTIDDVQISASGVAIDGVGGILGQAGPTALRPGTFLPYQGDMQFDTADLASLESTGQLVQVIQHEMAHVLGFGTIWTDKNLLTGAGTNDPQFTGTHATAQYNAIFNTTASSVPVENTGGPGTADAHWLETLFNNELMTGAINAGNNPISKVTIGQFEDLGYQVNYSAADPYTPPIVAGAGATPSSVVSASYTTTSSSSIAPTLDIGEMLGTTPVVGGPIPTGNATGSSTTPVGDGIHIVVTDNATLNPLLIANNNISKMGEHGIAVEASGNSNIPNLQIIDNILDQNGTNLIGDGIFISRSDSANLDASSAFDPLNPGGIIGNESTNNAGSGLEIVTTGTFLPDTLLDITNNTFTGNGLNGMFISGGNLLTINPSGNTSENNSQNGAVFQSTGTGIVTVVSNDETFTSSVGDIVALSALGTSTLNATFNNVTIQGDRTGSQTGNGLYIFGAEHGTLNVNIGGTTGSTIEDNASNGLAADIRENALLNLNVDKTLIQNNGADGLNLRRKDASLILASVTDSQILNNQDDGVQFNAEGGHPSDPNQPLVGTASQLTMTNVNVDNNGFLSDGTTVANSANGGNGLEVSTFADAVLVVNATTVTFNNNADDGIRVFSGDASSFGESTGNRSTFDNVEITNNLGNGIHLMSMGNNAKKASMFVEVNANTGNSAISSNGHNGIGATVPYGTLDLLVQGDTIGPNFFTTKIQKNAVNGIEFNVADLARDGFDAGTANSIYNYAFRNQSLVDLRKTEPFNGIGTLTVNHVIIGDEDPNDAFSNGNTDDGIAIYVGNSDLFAASSTSANISITPLIGIAGQMNLNVDQSVVAGNGLNGISVDSEGIHYLLSTVGGNQGNLLNIDVTNSLIAHNAQSGVDLQINGLHGSSIWSGFFGFPGTYDRLTENNIRFDGNTIQNNGFYGVLLNANAGAMQRWDWTQNGIVSDPFWGIFFADPSVVPGTATVFNPDAIGAAGWGMYNAGYASGIILDDYLNIATDNNTAFTFTNNVVQFNGTAESVTADGLKIRVSTDSYVSADIENNTFSGNVGADVRFDSFTATDANGNIIQPGAGTAGNDTAAPPVYDHIFLDDTAQLDLKFIGNTGRTLDSTYAFRIGGVGTAGETGAFYDNPDPTKGGSVIRPTQLFQVDDGFNLNTNNNWTTQDLQDLLQNSGNFYLRTVADPLFPNPDFPLNYNENPGNPFLP